MTDIYTDTEYSATMLAVLAEHRGFVIRKMPLKFGTRELNSMTEGIMMELDEAIKHCLEVAEQKETQAEKWQEEGGEEWGKTTACRECAAEHRQLAEWLRELKKAKRLLGEALRTLNDSSCNKDCRQCKWNGNCEMSCRFAWKYGDEVSALIGDENDDKP